MKEIAVRSVIGVNVVQTPLMIKTVDGLYIYIHEAALVDYPVTLHMDAPSAHWEKNPIYKKFWNIKILSHV